MTEHPDEKLDRAQRARHLWILRHAKAESNSKDGSDHSRALTKRGRAQAEATARHLGALRRSGMRASELPELVLSSSAKRALQTAQLASAGVGDAVSLEIETALYQADPDDVLDFLRELADDVSAVMVVGHNPTFAQLVELLVDPAEYAEKDRDSNGRLGSFPTCALARLRIEDCSWGDLDLGSAALEELYVPEV